MKLMNNGTRFQKAVSLHILTTKIVGHNILTDVIMLTGAVKLQKFFGHDEFHRLETLLKPSHTL